MRVAVIGAGGREHAICWKIAKSPHLKKLYCLPGNGGTSLVAENVPCALSDVEKVADIIKGLAVNLCIVGPEAPLAAGISDYLSRRGIAVWGPQSRAARLESSKSFAKKIMESAGIPTAKYKFYEEMEDAGQAVRRGEFAYPLVVKADGLAGGKGVFICSDKEEALKGISFVFQNLQSQGVVLEEFLVGREISYIAAVCGDTVVPLAASHDYKRLKDGDEGPNTGGMGAVSPTSRLRGAVEEKIKGRIIYPLLNALKNEGINYCGFLYCGLMVSEEGEPYVLEFNVRLGDPETQAILPRFKGDFLEFIKAMLNGEGNYYAKDEVWSKKTAVCVALASEGYPFSPRKGQKIRGLKREETYGENSLLFHGATQWNKERNDYTVNGGRVLYAVGLGETLGEARERAYNLSLQIDFDGKVWRNDIGLSEG